MRNCGGPHMYPFVFPVQISARCRGLCFTATNCCFDVPAMYSLLFVHQHGNMAATPGMAYRSVVLCFNDIVCAIIDGRTGDELQSIPSDTTDVIMVDVSGSMAGVKIRKVRLMCHAMCCEAAARVATRKTGGATLIYDCVTDTLHKIRCMVQAVTLTVMTDGDDNLRDDAQQKTMTADLMAMGVRMNIVFTGSCEERDKNSWLQWAHETTGVQGIYLGEDTADERYFAVGKWMRSDRSKAKRDVRGAVVGVDEIERRTIIVDDDIDLVIGGVPDDAHTVTEADAEWAASSELRVALESIASVHENTPEVRKLVLMFMKVTKNEGGALPSTVLFGRGNKLFPGARHYKSAANRCLSALVKHGILVHHTRTMSKEELTIKWCNKVYKIKVPKNTVRYEVSDTVTSTAIDALLKDRDFCAGAEAAGAEAAGAGDPATSTRPCKRLRVAT